MESLLVPGWLGMLPGSVSGVSPVGQITNEENAIVQLNLNKIKAQLRILKLQSMAPLLGERVVFPLWEVDLHKGRVG